MALLRVLHRGPLREQALYRASSKLESRAEKMAGKHQRNVAPMMASRRCGAKTRSGRPCKSPAVQGKARCRMHGGAAGSGAPHGNTNALKHGKFSRERIEEQRQIEMLLEQIRRQFYGRTGRR